MFNQHSKHGHHTLSPRQGAWTVAEGARHYATGPTMEADKPGFESQLLPLEVSVMMHETLKFLSFTFLFCEMAIKIKTIPILLQAVEGVRIKTAVKQQEHGTHSLNCGFPKPDCECGVDTVHPLWRLWLKSQRKEQRVKLCGLYSRSRQGT